MVLNVVPGLSLAQARKLREHCGSAREVLRWAQAGCSTDTLPNTAELLQRIRQFDEGRFLKGEIKKLRQLQARVVGFADDAYPEHLRTIADPPLVLYLRGKPLDFRGLAIALVGSRRCSVYGKVTAQRLASNLAAANVVVISGMAKGIDTAVHQGCLRAGGMTWAVMGCGLAHVYPPENYRLFEAIAEQGTLISEFSLTAPPRAYHFPRRNRVISGLSQGVVVVEATARSGALITARLALDQGREVFAVPGQADQPLSEGGHRLIQQGAKLVHRVEDIIEEFAYVIPDVNPPDEPACHSGGDPSGLSAADQMVVKQLSDEPRHLEELMAASTLQRGELFEALLRLEFSKSVRQLPGQRFVRTNVAPVAVK